MSEPESKASGRDLTVRSCKFDGSLHRSWPAKLLHRSDDVIVLEGEFEFTVHHEWLGRIERGTRARDFFWTDRWFSLFQFLDAAGKVQVEYINMNLPPSLNGDELTFIDLDIDLVLKSDGTYTILDEDEFQANAELYDYPAEIRAGLRDAVEEVLGLIRTGELAKMVERAYAIPA